MVVNTVDDIVTTQTVTYREADMALESADHSKLNVAICPNITPTTACHHAGFDEIYFVLDNWT